MKRSRLKRVSIRRSKEMAAYSALRGGVLKANPLCSGWLILAGYTPEEIGSIQRYASIFWRDNRALPWHDAKEQAGWFRENNLPFVHCPPSMDIHHMAGRGINYLNADYFLPVSRPVHDWIHTHPSEARMRGLLQ